MLQFQAIIQSAASGKRVAVVSDSARDANNMRQRFYRYRDKIRLDSAHPLNLVIDHIQFSVEGNSVIITYSDPTLLILENPNDNTSTSSAETSAKEPKANPA